MFTMVKRCLNMQLKTAIVYSLAQNNRIINFYSFKYVLRPISNGHTVCLFCLTQGHKIKINICSEVFNFITCIHYTVHQ